MIFNFIFGSLLLIGLIAKEEIVINEELVIAISFIITIAVIKTMVKDSANESFQGRAEEQENDFLTQGRNLIHIYQQISIYAYGLLQSNNVANNLIVHETKKFAQDLSTNKILSFKIKQFIDNKVINFSNIIADEFMKITFHNLKSQASLIANIKKQKNQIKKINVTNKKGVLIEQGVINGSKSKKKI